MRYQDLIGGVHTLGLAWIWRWSIGRNAGTRVNGRHCAQRWQGERREAGHVLNHGSYISFRYQYHPLCHSQSLPLLKANYSGNEGQVMKCFPSTATRDRSRQECTRKHCAFFLKQWHLPTTLHITSVHRSLQLRDLRPVSSQSLELVLSTNASILSSP